MGSVRVLCGSVFVAPSLCSINTIDLPSLCLPFAHGNQFGTKKCPRSVVNQPISKLWGKGLWHKVQFICMLYVQFICVLYVLLYLE